MAFRPASAQVSVRSQQPSLSATQTDRAAEARPISANRTLHDKTQFWQTKMEKSAPFFRGTRVQTCSHIVRKNGKAVAVQFPLEKTGWKAPTSYQNTKKSSECQSWT